MIHRKILDFLIKDIIPEYLIFEVVAKEFGIQAEQILSVNDDTSELASITYSILYNRTGFAISLSLFIDESQIVINKDILEITTSFAKMWVQEILIPVPTELPGFIHLNHYLLLVKPTGEMFLVIELDSEEGVVIDESPSMMKKIVI